MGRFSTPFLLSALISSLSLSAPAFAESQPLKTSSYEEAFLVRRIAEFFKDGDYQLVKSQISDFFKKYPDSPLKDHLQAVLGDLYLQEGHYEQALASYEAITDREIALTVFLNKLQSCYELSLYDKIIDEGLATLNSDADKFEDRRQEFLFLLAESLYRQALNEKDLAAKESLATMAGSFYEDLIDSSYSDISLFALADIYTMTNEGQNAVSTYKRLAEEHPDMKEELLFKAATCLASYDKEAAIKAYDQIIALDGHHMKEAQFNQFILHFGLGHYDKVVDAFAKIERIIPEAQRATFEYMLGKSYFIQGDYKQALGAIKSYLDSSLQDNAHLKNALLISMTCSYELKDRVSFSEALGNFKKDYANDAEMPKALFMQAMLSKEAGQKEEALEELGHIMQTYQNFEQREGLLYEYAYIAYQNQKWPLAKETIQSYLRDFPHTHREADAWKLFLASNLEIYKQEESKPFPQYGKAQLFGDLAKVMDKEAILTDDERRDYEWLYAKLAYELGHYPKCLTILNQVIKRAPEELLPQAYFLTALCECELNHSPFEIVAHFEKVLELDPHFNEKALVHVNLFNQYLAIHSSTDIEAIQEGALDKAAENLFDALSYRDQPIKLENKLWLCDYYYQKSHFYFENQSLLTEADRKEAHEWALRATNLYKEILLPLGTHHLVKLEPATLYLEPEVLKFAELLEFTHDPALKIALLTGLVEQQEHHPDWNWSFQRNTLFELAKAYENHGELEKALETYSFISEREKSLNSPIINIAAFHSAKLRFQLLEEGQKAENNEEIHEILTSLKELQIKKNVDSEPIHLEAALEYARVRSLVAQESERDNRYLFFLNRFIDDFNSKNDLISKSYFDSLEGDVEKQNLFNLYMQFVEAEKLRLSAKEKKLQNQFLEAEELNEQALALLFDIEGNELAKDYLRTRALKSIEAINQAESF